MRKSCDGLVESRLPCSRWPGLVRQASGVMVAVGAGEGGRVAVCVEVLGTDVGVGRGRLEGEQAVMMVRNVSSIETTFFA